MTADKNDNLEYYISLAEASSLSGYHQDYLGQLCRAGKLAGKKLGRNWVTTKFALDELMEKCSDLTRAAKL